MLGWLAGGVVVAGGGLYCWAYGPAGYFTRDRVKLRALRADPMSSTTLLGLRAFGVEETEPSSWFSIEPLSRMRLTRRFQEDGSTSEDLMGRLVAYAQEQGWAADPDPSFPSMWIGGRPPPPQGGGGGGGEPPAPPHRPAPPPPCAPQVELFY